MYVEGFVIPVRTARRADYAEQARIFAAFARKHGATRVVECWQDDVPEGEVTSFPRAVGRTPDESICFSWIEYPDKATRDACVAAMRAEPALAEPMDTAIADGRRLIYGGFTALIDES